MAVFSGNGSNASPSFTFSSDNNTGMYRADADKLGFATAGSSRMVIDGTGNVGINNLNPVGRLSVELPSATNLSTISAGSWDNTYVLVGDSDNANGACLGLGFRTGGITPGFGAQIASLDPGADWFPINYHGNTHHWYNGTTQVMGTTTGGTVLVGTTSLRNTIATFQNKTAHLLQSNYSEGDVVRVVKYASGSGSSATILTLSIPTLEVAVLIEATYFGSRAPASAVGASRVSKKMYVVSRNGGGSDVVITSNINSLDFDVATTTAGGTEDKAAMVTALARTGAEPNTAAQEVSITLDPRSTNNNFSGVLAYFDISIIGGTNITIS